MPEPYEEDPADEFSYGDDWLESIGDSQPGGGTAVAYGNQEATLTGFVPWNKQRSAARWFLGYSWADAESPYALHREAPQPHPVWPQLRAHSVSFAGLAPKANFENTPASALVTSPFQAPDGGELFSSSFEYAVATVRYRNFGRVRFLPDEQVADYTEEYKRYVRWSFDPRTEVLSAEGSSQLKFAEGPVLPPTPLAQPFPAPIAELLSKAALAVTWLNVPHDYLSADEDVLFPTKILSCLGTINDALHIGFPAGELLLTAFKAEEVLYPVVADDPDDYPLSGWTLTFLYEHFDPPKGVPASPYRGHRLVPWARDGRWYYATRADGVNGMIPLADHSKIFQNVRAP